MDSNLSSGQLVRIIDEEWREYLTASGRKVYRNEATQQTTWKPPRRPKIKKEKLEKPPIEEIHPNTASSWSLPTNPDENIGGILRKGSLRITQAYLQETTKTDWHKCIAYLTNTHFVYRRKKKLDDHAGKMPLSLATVQTRHGKSKQYELCATRSAIFFKSKNKVEAEAWFHAIAAVIHSLSKPKPQRPWSFIEFGSFPPANGMFVSDFNVSCQQKQDYGEYSDFERRILEELIERNRLGEERTNFHGLKALFGKSEKKVSFNAIADPSRAESKLKSVMKEAASSKESLLSMPAIEEEEPEYSEVIDSQQVSENARSCKHCKMLVANLGVVVGSEGGIGIKADIKRGENEKTADEEDRRRDLLTDNKGNSAKIAPQGREMLSIGKTAITRPETKQPYTRSQPEIEPGDVIKNENALPPHFKHISENGFLPPKFKYPTPPGWVARFDERSEQYLYENLQDLDVWAAATGRDDSVFFYNTESLQTSWLLPSEENDIFMSVRKETSL